MTTSPLILLVEDNPADARLTIEAFRRTDARIQVEVCEDGESALARLRDSSAAIPSMVLLDLNLPGIDGREVLHEIKQDPVLCRIPVCILSTSAAQDDIERAYAKHSNCYVVKPVDLNTFRTVIQQIERFWFGTAKLPYSRTAATP